VMTFTDVLTAN